MANKKNIALKQYMSMLNDAGHSASVESKKKKQEIILKREKLIKSCLKIQLYDFQSHTHAYMRAYKHTHTNTRTFRDNDFQNYLHSI